MTVVIDASCAVALLSSTGKYRDWAARATQGHVLCAPPLMLPEAANTLRNHVIRGELSADAATLAHTDLCYLPVRYWNYQPLGERIWALRHAVTAYDANYVALAEYLHVPLATLDERLARSHAPACTILSPGSS